MSRIVHITFPFQHHGGHSGYHLLSSYIRNVKIVADWQSYWVANASWADLSRLHKMGIQLMNHIPVTEVSLFPRMILSHQTVHHFLYAENSFNYSSLFRRKGSPIVCSFHQPAQRLEKVWRANRTNMSKKALGRIDQVIALGESQVDILEDIVGAGKVTVIPHGIDTQFFSPAEKVSEDKVVLTVGSWLRDYSMLSGVASKILLKDRYVKFRVIASERMLSNYNLPDNVEVISALSDTQLLKAYREATILFLPLLDGVANNALLEGLACGTPIVVNDIGDVRYYLGSDTGVCYSNCDEEDVADMIMDLLSNQSLMCKMRRTARSRAEQLSWNAISGRYMKLYDRLLA